MPMNDDDILSQLEEIDAEQITGEEISLDDGLDLDFDDEGVPLSGQPKVEPKPKKAQEARAGGKSKAERAEPKAERAEPKAERAEPKAERAERAEPKAERAERAEPKAERAEQPKSEQPKAVTIMPPSPQKAAKSRSQDVPAPMLAAAAPTADAPAAASATVQEMVLHAKILRIVADTVVIEPGNISIS